MATHTSLKKKLYPNILTHYNYLFSVRYFLSIICIFYWYFLKRFLQQMFRKLQGRFSLGLRMQWSTAYPLVEETAWMKFLSNTLLILAWLSGESHFESNCHKGWIILKENCDLDSNVTPSELHPRYTHPFKTETVPVNNLFRKTKDLSRI